MYMLLKSAKSQLRIARTAIVAIAIWAGPSSAIEGFDSFQTHGFISQGYFLSSDNNIHGKSSDDHGTLGLTEIGLNSSFRPLNNIRLAIQGIYRHAGEVSDDARIDYALIDWTAIEHENHQLGIRLGRIKNPFGLFNDTRDVAFTRSSITLPSLYQERARDLFLSSDGGQLYLDMSTHIGDFSLQINGGKLSDNPKELEISIFNTDMPGQLTSQPSYMGKLEFENTSGSTRLAISYANVEMKYKPAAAIDFSEGDLTFKLLLFSLQQHIGELTLTAEYLRTDNSITNLGPHFPDFKPVSESYYLQGNYQLTSYLQGIVRYDVAYSNIDDKDGDTYAYLTGNPSYAAYSKSYMFGLRWSPKSDWLLQAEYHRINGTSELSFADNPNPSTAKQHWDLFALQLSYRF